MPPLAMLGTTVVVSPQLLGGAYGWGVSIIAALSGATALATAWHARQSGLRSGVGSVTLALGAALAWTAIQALPLPRTIVAWLQPQAVEATDAAARLLGADPPSWLPLSVSPAGTMAQVVVGAALLATFSAAWLLSREHRGWVLRLVAASTVAMAAVALAHLAAGSSRIFGIYEQIHTASRLPAPLLNQNHLGGFLTMGVPVLVGIGLDAEDKGKRIAWLVAAASVGATALLTTSRGAAASLVCGLLVFGLLAVRRGRGRGRGREGKRDVGTALTLAAATLATAIGFGLYAGSGVVYEHLRERDFSKLDLSLQGLQMALDHPWVGVGRGAFSAAFVAEHGTQTRFTHPENIVAQWTSEWGLVFGLALLVFLATAALRGAGRARTWSRVGAGAGLIAIAVHDLVDFALEMPGVAVVAVALLAGVVRAPHRRAEAAGGGGVRLPPGWAAAAAGGLLALVLTAAVGWRLDAQSVPSLQDELVEHLEARERQAFAATLRRAVALHPSEPAFPLLAGAEAVSRRDLSALPWLNRTMSLAPKWGTPHALTAELLARRGRAIQALLEAREAEERQPGGGTRVARRLLEDEPTLVSEMIRIAGDDGVGRGFLDRVAATLPLSSELAVTLDEHLAERGVAAARVRRARRALEAEEPRAALAELAPIEDVADTNVQLTRARALVMSDRADEAVSALRQTYEWSDRPEDVLRLMAQAQVTAGDAEGMRRTMQRLRGRAAGRAARVARVWVTQGQLERQLGNDGRAMQAFERAARLDPESHALRHVAHLAEELGQLGRSYSAYGQLCRQHGEGSSYCQARARVRRRMTEPPPLAAQPLTGP